MIGDSGGVAASFGDFFGRVAGNFHSQYAGRAGDYFFDLFVGVKFQPEGAARKSRTQRGREHSHSGGGGDKGERWQFQLDASRRRALADDDIQRPGFHRRIKDFFNSFVQPVDFVYKKYVSRRKIGENGSQVAHPFYGRAGSGLYLRPQLFGYQKSEGGLAQSGRAVKKQMLYTLFSLGSGLNKDAEVLFY